MNEKFSTGHVGWSPDELKAKTLPILRLWRWFFPDTDQVNRGTLWLAKRPFYQDRYSCHDLCKVSEVCTSGVVLTCTISHEGDWRPFRNMPHVSCSETWMNYELVRHRRKVSESEAKALGFKTNSRDREPGGSAASNCSEG